MIIRIASLALLLALAHGPAHAWLAGVEGPVCTLDHSGAEGDVRLTFDPSLPLYTIAITRADPWPEAPVFAIRFEGPQGNTISTGRHVLSEDARTLTVSDRGFGNVLDGMSFNEVAIALAGETGVTIDLDGAASEVAIFRACQIAPSA